MSKLGATPRAYSEYSMYRDTLTIHPGQYVMAVLISGTADSVSGQLPALGG